MAHDAAMYAAHLLADGYCIVPEACSRNTIAELDRDLGTRFASTPFCEGGFYGERTKRFGALLRRSNYADAVARHRLVLNIVDAVLGQFCDRTVLNLTQAMEIHPGALAQIPHRDQDLWGLPRGEREYQVNVIWPATPFTADNGATLVWSGSHHAEAADPPVGEPIVAEMEPGSALVFLGSVLHGAGGNLTNQVRRGIVVGYCLGWLRTFENQYLVYPPAVARDFDPELAALIGYAQHRPNLGNVEGQCPSILLERDDFDNLAAIDALKPDQAEALREYVASQKTAGAGPTET